MRLAGIPVIRRRQWLLSLALLCIAVSANGGLIDQPYPSTPHRPKPGDFRMDYPVFHVDADWRGPHKGTAEAPFRTLVQAIEAVARYELPGEFTPPHRDVVRIYIADGEYALSQADLDGILERMWQGEYKRRWPSPPWRGAKLCLIGGFAGWNDGEAFDWRTPCRAETVLKIEGDGNPLQDLRAGRLELGGISVDGPEVKRAVVLDEDALTADVLAGLFPTYHVSADGEGDGTGTAASPFGSMTAALAAIRAREAQAPPEGTLPMGLRGHYRIRVSEGTYNRTVERFGEDGLTVPTGVRLSILGGHVRRGSDWVRADGATSIIDPEGESRAFLVSAEDDADVLTWVAFDGLTFRNGMASGEGMAGEGGAVLVRGKGAGVFFCDCLFENNRAAGNGGALRLATASMNNCLMDCRFRQNSAAGDGGGFSSGQANTGSARHRGRGESTANYLVVRCEFSENRAANGGAIDHTRHSLTIQDTDMHHNAADKTQGYGGGIHATARLWTKRLKAYANTAAHGGAIGARQSVPWIITYSLFYANGGDFAIDFTLHESITNRLGTFGHRPFGGLVLLFTTIADNEGGGLAYRLAHDGQNSGYRLSYSISHGNGGAGIHFDDADADIENWVVWSCIGGNAGGDYSGVAEPCLGCTREDPLFRDRTNEDLAKRDYAIGPGSPCINQTVNYDPHYVRKDLNGFLHNDDMGAYRYEPRDGDAELARREGRDVGRELLRKGIDRFYVFRTIRGKTFEYYVDRDWPGPHKGTREQPFRSISQAIGAFYGFAGAADSFNGNSLEAVIRVAEGTYDRSVEDFGRHGIWMEDGQFSFRGGYVGWNGRKVDGAVFDWSEDQRTPRASILDPEGKSRAFRIENDSGGTFVFDGFTFQNCYANTGGGAIYLGAYGVPAVDPGGLGLKNCLFRNCKAEEDAGVAFAGTSINMATHIEDCEFVGNRARHGGALVLSRNRMQTFGAPYRISRCVFRDNLATGDGGALVLGSAAAGWRLEDCTFVGNRARRGGAVFSRDRREGVDNVIQRSTFSGNVAEAGAALCSLPDKGMGAAWTIMQSVFRDNEGPFAIAAHRPSGDGLGLLSCTIADNRGGGVVLREGRRSDLRVVDCVVADNNGVGVRYEAPASSRPRARLAWSAFHDNADGDVAGPLKLGATCFALDPKLADDRSAKLSRRSALAAAGDEPVTLNDVTGKACELPPGYRMGAFGFRDGPIQWRPDSIDYHVDSRWRGARSDGTSAAPFRRLADAIAAANDLGERSRQRPACRIRVAEGTYRPDTEAYPGGGHVLEGGRVSIEGGYVGWDAEAEAFDWNPDRRTPRSTVLDANGKSRVLHVAGSDGLILTLGGLTFTGGKAGADGGGAVYVGGQRSLSPRRIAIRDCAFTGNSADTVEGEGGGLYVKWVNDHCEIADTRFAGNRARNGGGAIVCCPLDVQRSLFERNEAAWDGGGIKLRSPVSFSTTFRDTVFRHNTAKHDGGGIFQMSLTFANGYGGGVGGRLERCRLYGNRANRAGALGANHTMDWTIRHSLIYANGGAYAIGWRGITSYGLPQPQLDVRFTTIADNDGAGIDLVSDQWFHPMRRLTVRGCIITGNGREGLAYTDLGQPHDKFDLAYNCIRGNTGANYSRGHGIKRFAPGEGAVWREPGFVDNTNADLSKRDYSLRPDSPLLNLTAEKGATPPPGNLPAAQGEVTVDLPDGTKAYYRRAPAGYGLLAKVYGRDVAVTPNGMTPVGGRLQQDLPRATCVRAEAPPQIDGRVDDDLWRTAEPIRLTRRRNGADADVRSTGWFAYDQKHLYFAFRCDEPRMERLKTISDERDEPMHAEQFQPLQVNHILWCPWSRDNEDHIALMLDGNLDRWDHTMHAFNARGTVVDGRTLRPDEMYDCMRFNLFWNAETRVKTHRAADAWTVEGAIPWTALEREAPQAGEVVGMNLSRYRAASGRWTQWSPMRPGWTPRDWQPMQSAAWLHWGERAHYHYWVGFETLPHNHAADRFGLLEFR